MPNPLHRQSYSVFRNMLIEARQQSGLTQVQIAELMGKPQSFVSKYERGERRLDFTEFLELADVLGVNVSKFVTAYRASLRTGTTRI